MADVRVYYLSYHRKNGGYFTEEYYNKERAHKLYQQYLRSKQKEDVQLRDVVVFRDTPELDRYLTWCINYYAHAIGKKITWKYKPFRARMEEGHEALAYRDKGYIAICPVAFYNYWKLGQRALIKDIIAHEVMHFRVMDEVHGPKFKEGMKQWTGETRWPWWGTRKKLQ